MSDMDKLLLERFILTFNQLNTQDQKILYIKENPEYIYRYIEQLNIEHTQLGKIILEVNNLLGNSTSNDISKTDILTDALKLFSITNMTQKCQDDIQLIQKQILKIQSMLNMIFKDTSQNNNKIQLKIQCHYVNGELRIGYLRDMQGKDHNIIEDKSTTSFLIEVEMDEYLNSNNISNIIHNVNIVK